MQRPKRIIAAYVLQDNSGRVLAVAKRDRIFIDRHPETNRKRACIRFVVHMRGCRRERDTYEYGAHMAYDALWHAASHLLDRARIRRLLRDADRDHTPVLPMEGLPDGV